ncbi:Ecto-ADP-ribosyltransferase 4 [Cichlidogyrus casuarinus]|uniref:type I protein arginine methyltransferase n=1 Tax=Cichlidogyrus casuarinus TaxID=1844966 RepID=A0ABD2QJV6_9PLAT
MLITGHLDIGRVSADCLSIYNADNQTDENKSTYFVKFLNQPEKIILLKKKLNDFNASKSKEMKKVSLFDRRTDATCASQYFQFYSYLSQQQNMMQDFVRTSTYQTAMTANASVDFRDKVVLDVGAGSGILSFFAAHCGAKRVYAVEASNMAKFCENLVHANKLAGKIIVIAVDVIISEPMGYMLFNERMLESYVHARKFLAKKYLQPVLDAEGKPTDSYTNKALPRPGMMFPSVGHLYIAPFSDEALFLEQQAKANFWYQQHFHGMDLSSLREAAMQEYFNQPVVDSFDISICPAAPVKYPVDFRTIDESEFEEFSIDLQFNLLNCCTIHGLAFWFDVGFLGSKRQVWLSTSPTEQLTHWYQVRCLFTTPLFVQEDQVLSGMVRMRAHSRQSYDVDIELVIPGTTSKISNTIDLKNPHFRYTGYPTAPPPGSHSKSPTDAYVATNMGGQVSNEYINGLVGDSIDGGTQQEEVPNAAYWNHSVTNSVVGSATAMKAVVNSHKTSGSASVNQNTVHH